MSFGSAEFINDVTELTLEQIQNNLRMEQRNFMMDLGVKENTTIDFTISQLLFSGEYIVGLQASRTYKELSQQSYEKAVVDIKKDVKTSYYLVLVLHENLKTVLTSGENLNSMIAEMEKMLAVGFVEDTDVDQLKLTLMNLENTISTLKRQLVLAEKLLKFQMGVDLRQHIQLTDNLDGFVATTDVNMFLQSTLVLDQNIDYQIMTTQEKLQNLNYKREKSTVLPTVAAFYRHQELADAPEFNFNPPNVVGINVEIPIFASGSRYSKIQQEKMELEKIRNSKLQVGDGLVLEYEQAISELTSAWEKYNNEKLNMELAKKIYDKTAVKYKEGMSSSMDLTQTQNQYLQNQSNYYNAILDVLNSRTKLETILSKSDN